jgi:hypothetical protein
MLMTTLAEVPGVVFEVKGLVFADAKLHAIGGGNLPKMVKSLVEQQLGANGIVDIRTAVGGDAGCCVMTGQRSGLGRSSAEQSWVTRPERREDA